MYVNVGAWVGDGTMIDSHALVGSCAQVGRRCHISAAAQIGGVLEPVGALPVIVEDEALVGGNCGVYEGAIVKRGAVLGAGVILTRSTPVFDIVRGEVLRADGDLPLVIPGGAVVVPGSRPIGTGIGTLTPTIPTCISSQKRRALSPSRVKMAVPLPYSCSLIRRTASSRVCTRTTLSTGPKISSS